jgi:hypothetical protein
VDKDDEAPRPSGAETFLAAATSRTKYFDGWNDSYAWNRGGLPKTWLNYTSGLLGVFAIAVPPLAIAAVVLGHLGIAAARRGEASVRPFGVAGIVFGYTIIAMWLTIGALVVLNALS